MTETIVIDSDDGTEERPASKLAEAYGFHLAPCSVSVAPSRHRSCKKPNCLVRIFSPEHSRGFGGIWTPPIPEVSALKTRLKEITPRSPLSLPVGLYNMGATCYINSLLQMLYANNRFRNAILQTTWSSPILRQMQRLFAKMSLTICSTITPTEFVNSLSINNDVHQDLHEFNKLLLQHIQDTASPLSLVEDEYHGQLSFITQCNSCYSVSKRCESFADLQLNLTESLDTSFEELIAPELLKDDNSYFCEVCKEKQVAQRRLQLDRLPRCINLHLLRFIFEKETFRKAKSFAKIRIPKSIDMSKYIARYSPEPILYDLIAVLRHQGASVDSGHFMVDILGKDNQTWYRFNDHHVKKVVDGLALDDSINSSNAYMLVYTERNLNLAENASACPIEYLADSALAKEICEENRTIEVQHALLTKEIEELDQRIDQRKSEIRSLYSPEHAVSLLDSYTEFDENATVLPVDWFRDWVQNLSNRPLDCSPIICPHGRLDPLQFLKMARISNSAWSIIEKTLSSPIMVPPSKQLCNTCIEHGEHREALRSLLQRMQRDLSGDPNASWISARYLRALNAALKSSSQLPPFREIQEGVLCPHDGLCLSKANRSLIDNMAFDLVKALSEEHSSKTPPKITCQTAVCLICQEHRDRNREERTADSNARKVERNLLKSTIRLGDRRPGSGSFYIIPTNWFELWNDFTRINAGNGKLNIGSPGPIPTRSLLCEDHGSLLHSLSWASSDAISEEVAFPLRLVVSSEYSFLKARYGISGPDIHVTFDDGSDADGMVCSHAVCTQCIEWNQRKSLSYIDGTVRVIQEQDAAKTLQRKRKRRDRSSAIELQVNSSDLIGNLKLRLWEHLDVHPSRQSLVDLNFNLLSDSFSLEQCGIPKDGTLIVRIAEADKKDDDIAVDMTNIADAVSSERRAGFAGSALHPI